MQIMKSKTCSPLCSRAPSELLSCFGWTGQTRSPPPASALFTVPAAGAPPKWKGPGSGEPGRIAALQTRVQELQTQQDLQSARLHFCRTVDPAAAEHVLSNLQELEKTFQLDTAPGKAMLYGSRKHVSARCPRMSAGRMSAESSLEYTCFVRGCPRPLKQE